MRVSAHDVIRIRLAPASERYARIARKAVAMAFAADLADVCPNVGARVYFGGERAAGWIVTLGDDREAAVAAGAERLFWHARGESEGR